MAVVQIIVGIVVWLALLASAAMAEEPASAPQTATDKSLKEIFFGTQELGWADFDWETDLYYSNVSLNIPLTDKPMLNLSGKSELEVYSTLFVDSLIPRYMLFEAAVMPMPLVGIALKEYANDFYRSADIGKNQNLIKWITTGFEEPYAFSVFVGDMVRFSKPGEDRLSSNKGYMGYMLSYSNQHIKNNVLIPDHSLEAEWKLKGERSFKEDKLSWSFRLGAKIHQNPNIANTFYLGFRRSDLDFSVTPLVLLKNTSFDLRWDFSQKTGAVLRQEYVVGKKIPVKSWGVALKLDLGVIWEASARYTGVLRDSDVKNLSIVLRPNILF